MIAVSTPMAGDTSLTFRMWLDAPRPQGPDGIRLLNEARRIKNLWPSGSQMVGETASRASSAESFEQHLRAYALQHGVDLDASVEAAAAHFRSAVIQRRTNPLSEEELECLCE